MSSENRIDYLEIPCKKLEESCRFFTDAFGWEFKSFSEDYSVFTNGGMNGGFFRADRGFLLSQGAPLIVLYREDLPKAIDAITESGGKISHPIFTFPGGSRFHFTDPSGNEYAVWSDK